MLNSRAILTAVMLAALAQAVLAQSAPVESKVLKQAQLDQLIETIRKTDNPSTAVSAYARGCAIDRRNGELNNVYMKRMLQFGLPQIAYNAAQILTADEPDNGLAWAVTGYATGKKGDYAAALAASIRALQSMPKDPSMLNNTGQLLAWYDAQVVPPVLNDVARRIIDKSREQWDTQKDFRKAYERVGTVLMDRRAQDKEIDGRIAAAQKALEDAQKKVQGLERDLRDNEDDLAHHRDTLRALRREYWLNGWIIDPVTGQRVYDPNSTPYREQLLVRIHDEERTIDGLSDNSLDIRKNGRAALKEYQDKQAALEQMKAKKGGKDAKLDRSFRWDPPAVDGVMTPEVEVFPTLKGDDTATSLPADPKLQAQKKLELARLYLVNDMPRKAAEILQEIVSQYGKTEAAQEAKSLLEKIPAEK